jgi:hypothetical protein
MATRSRRLPGIRLVARVSGTASAATITAYRLTSRPAVDSVTPNALPIAGSSPTGAISVVTAANTDSDKMMRPARAPPSSGSAGSLTPFLTIGAASFTLYSLGEDIKRLS